MSLKHKAIQVLERQLTKQALILDIRPWNGNTFFEVDLHVPDADFSKANTVQHLKCRVAPLTFNDYTVSGWDAETQTCTLMIDAGHNGAGAKWVKNLTKPGEISYLKTEQHRYPAMDHGKWLLLGDQSAVGHFLALKQLAGHNPNISGAVIIPDIEHCKQLRYFYPDFGLKSIPLHNSYTESILAWLEQQPVIIYDGICIAGNTRMVIDVRNYLKKRGVAPGKIKAQGFWE
jgi:NADPH-dependent ferric siderophore reductase